MTDKEAPTEPTLLVDGMTAAQLVGNELFEFQEATGCDTAAQYKAKVEASTQPGDPYFRGYRDGQAEMARDPRWKDSPAIRKAIRNGEVEVAPTEPFAWVNLPFKTDEKGNLAGRGEPELGFRRLSYGYDWQNAKPLYLATPAQAIRNGEVTLSPTDEQIREALKLCYRLFQTFVPSDQGWNAMQTKAKLAVIKALALKREPAQQAVPNLPKPHTVVTPRDSEPYGLYSARQLIEFRNL